MRQIVMRQIAFVLAIVLAACSPAERTDSETTQSPAPESVAQPVADTPTTEDPAIIPWPAGLPIYDHVVIVVNENKDYREIIRQPGQPLKLDAPYINDVLVAEGAQFTQSFGTEHLSQGNYYWLFSGANQGVGHQDNEFPGPPFMTPNLGSQLIAAELTFKGYSEGLPAIGSMVWEDDETAYARRHVPWTGFGNVPNGTTVETSSNLRFEDFPSDFNDLPTVAFVIPNLNNDMHDPVLKPGISVPQGDTWLQENLNAYYQWAKTHNSLLIYTFDECNDRQLRVGLTNPFEEIPEGKSCLTTGKRKPALERACDWQNLIVTIFAGARIEQGQYDEAITHVNVLRTLESMYGLPKAGAQQEFAAAGGISDDFIITNVFTPEP
jgi:hypothetical protein